MQVYVEVDEYEVLRDLTDADLLEEAKSRGLVLVDHELTDENLNVLHEVFRYKGSEAVLKELSTLIYERLGKIVY